MRFVLNLLSSCFLRCGSNTRALDCDVGSMACWSGSKIVFGFDRGIWQQIVGIVPIVRYRLRVSHIP